MKTKDKYEIRSLTLENGLKYPSNKELIMLILGNGTKGCPVDVIADRTIDIIESSNQEELIPRLTNLPGLGVNKALAVAAALELGQRLNKKPEVTINKPCDIIPYVQHYAIQKKEHFIAVTLNGSRELLSIRVICTGSGNMAIINPSEIYSEALKEYASAIILCHNHPSGIASPSEEDIKTTERLSKAAGILGIAMLDHIIITKDSYFSFLEHDILH